MLWARWALSALLWALAWGPPPPPCAPLRVAAGADAFCMHASRQSLAHVPGSLATLQSCAAATPSLPRAQRRLILGIAASVGLGAFALVPTQQLQLAKPSKPLFFYLVPLLRRAPARLPGRPAAYAEVPRPLQAALAGS